MLHELNTTDRLWALARTVQRSHRAHLAEQYLIHVGDLIASGQQLADTEIPETWRPAALLVYGVTAVNAVEALLGDPKLPAGSVNSLDRKPPVRSIRVGNSTHPTNRKWVITPVISGSTLLIPVITGIITQLLGGL